MTTNELFGIDIHYDRRCKVGNLVPDKKTGRYYRMHPDTGPILKRAVAKANAQDDHKLQFRDYYRPKIAGLVRLAGLS